MRTIDQAFTLKEFEKQISQGKKLRIKYGVDVTAPFLHIGHAVNFWMMRMLQDLGHKVVFLIGDFTTLIGDPTGKSQTRPQIPREEIEKNAAEFIKQVGQVLHTDESVFEVRHNSEWFTSMSVSDFLGLLSKVTHGRLIQRDMFQKRIKDGTEIYMHEMLYPILQGYDSAMLKSDLTIVGSDQLFNELMGRFYQELAGQPPQVVLTTKITMGTDGKNKQSKSLNNYIALADSPQEKYGKLMSISDQLVPSYLEVYTALPKAEIDALTKNMKKEPMLVKKTMAHAIVTRYHGPQAADKAAAEFTTVFKEKGTPADVQTVKVKKGTPLIDVLVAQKMIASKSEARRLIEQDGIKLNDKNISDVNAPVEEGIVKIGKRKFLRISFS